MGSTGEYQGYFLSAESSAHARRIDGEEGSSDRDRLGQRPVLRSLVRTVEGEIVPRLLLARRQPWAQPARVAPKLQPSDADEFARLLLHDDIELPFGYIQQIRHRGIEVRDIYLRLFAPAARQLGEMWERDECDFMQVTVGLCRLQQLLNRIGQMMPSAARLDSRGRGRRVLLASTPGEAHSLGVMMVSQFFRQSGWDVWNEFPDSERDLSACVRRQSFALVGLSLCNERLLDSLASAVRAVRRASQNRAVGIMVGGHPFKLNPELAHRVGADASAEDGEQAAQQAERVCALLAGEY
jgi:methanogenic corrinoid protein MtbC1